MIFKAKQLIRNIFILFKMIFIPKSEPFAGIKTAWRHLTTGKFYPNKEYYDFTREIQVTENNNFKFANYNNVKIAYPKAETNQRIKLMLNAILNEQSEDSRYESPHGYLKEYNLDKEDTVYDLGAAEGYQSKSWIGQVKSIVIFEPAFELFNTLKETFKEELIEDKVILINEGISDKKSTLTYRGEIFQLDSLDSMIKRHNLPEPTYIKVDIEGEEMPFLKGAKETLSKKNIKLLEITTYHHPKDYIEIPKFLSQYKGNGKFTKGVVAFNRKGYKYPGLIAPFSPVFRKSIFSYYFN